MQADADCRRFRVGLRLVGDQNPFVDPRLGKVMATEAVEYA